MKRGTIVKSIVIGLALVGMLAFAGTAQADFTNTFDFGPQDGGTTLEVGIENFLPWIVKGALPAGSILTSVSIDMRLDSQPDGSDSWTSDLFIYFDGTPSAPGTNALLQIGADYTGAIGTVAQLVGWDGGDGGPGGDQNTVIDTKTAGDDWSGDIDLHDVQLSIGNSWSPASWSGTVSVTYVPEPATMSLLVLGSLAMLRRRRRA